VSCITALCLNLLVVVPLSQGQATASNGQAQIVLPTSDPQNKGGWTPYEPLSDEFRGPLLDRLKWHTGVAGWPGRPPALFIAQNVGLADGLLDITMRKEPAGEQRAAQGFHDYTTGAVQSAASILYGYFEVRARAMKSAGSSGFWLAHKDDENWNEIDIAEMGGSPPADPQRVFMSVHVFKKDGVDLKQQDIAAATLTSNVAEDFHIYGLRWTEKSLDFYIDGVLRRHLENTSWHSPATIILDAETQGDWWGLPQESDLPSVFAVDYVRVWKQGEE
jgi:beta-glucanase (GH16 family)